MHSTKQTCYHFEIYLAFCVACVIAGQAGAISPKVGFYAFFKS